MCKLLESDGGRAASRYTGHFLNSCGSSIGGLVHRHLFVTDTQNTKNRSMVDCELLDSYTYIYLYKYYCYEERAKRSEPEADSKSTHKT